MRHSAATLKRILAVMLLAGGAALLPTFGQGATNISTIEVSQNNAAIQICGGGCIQVLQQFNIAVVSVNQGGLDYVGAAYLSARTYDFGNTVHAQSHSFTLTNTSASQPLIVPPGAIGMSGANPSDFTPSSTCPIVLLPGGHCTIAVTFTPATTGPRSAVLAVRDSAFDSPEEIDLSGTGVAATVSPAALDFGSIGIGSPAAAQVVTIRNPGLDALAVPHPSITGAGASDFATDGCGSVAGGTSCSLRVSFTAGDAGLRQATLTVTPAGLGGPFAVALSGTGVPLVLEPGSLDFGSVLVGTRTLPRDLTLENRGRAPLTVDSVALGGSEAAAFAVSTACSDGSLGPGASCAIHATFLPAAAGGASATVTIGYRAGGSSFASTAALHGVGIEPGLSAPASVSFGTTLEGRSTSQPVVLANPGTANNSIASLSLKGPGAADYSLEACGPVPITIAPGGQCVVTVSFSPRATGEREATLRIADSAASSPHVVTLTGTGAVQAVPTPTPTPTPAPGGSGGGTSGGSSSGPGPNAAVAGTVVAAGQPGLPNTGAASVRQTPCLVGFISPAVGRVELAWLLALGLLLLAGLGLAIRRHARADDGSA